MYTDTQEALRNSLWNFMGSIMNASMHDDARKKENVTALVSEELCKFCKTEDETSVDMQVAKPILKATVWVLQARKSEMEKAMKETNVIEIRSTLEKSVDDLSDLISTLNNYIEKL